MNEWMDGLELGWSWVGGKPGLRDCHVQSKQKEKSVQLFDPNFANRFSVKVFLFENVQLWIVTMLNQ